MPFSISVKFILDKCGSMNTYVHKDIDNVEKVSRDNGEEKTPA